MTNVLALIAVSFQTNCAVCIQGNGEDVDWCEVSRVCIVNHLLDDGSMLSFTNVTPWATFSRMHPDQAPVHIVVVAPPPSLPSVPTFIYRDQTNATPSIIPRPDERRDGQ